uniref:Uncharacterized protein n=1 Tax=viral metagenome TaxID=1070528 RepID=A0A6H2A4S9_9ZZZZ
MIHELGQWWIIYVTLNPIVIGWWLIFIGVIELIRFGVWLGGK